MKNKLFRITTVPISLEKLLHNQLRYIKDYYDVVAISSDKNNLDRVGILEEISTYHVEMTRKITPLSDLKALWRLYLYFIKEKPFIVHTHTPKAGTLGMLAAKLAGVPHRLHTIAGLPLLETFGAKRLLLIIVEKATYACATKIYPNSIGLKNIVINRKFCKPAKLKVIGNGSSNGIDTTFFSRKNISLEQIEKLRIKIGIHPNDFVFIFVGRLVGDKGINELVAAFKKVQSSNIKVESLDVNLFGLNETPSIKLFNPKLVLVGNLESDLDPLQAETLLEMNSNPNIVCVGFQEDVRPFMALSDCFVFPSYREGFPNVIMQAGAMELPCIVTNINGCNEIIIEGQNGTLIPKKDVTSLFRAMNEMMLNYDFLSSRQQNARRMIVSRYEQKFFLEAILAEYRGLEHY